MNDKLQDIEMQAFEILSKLISFSSIIDFSRVSINASTQIKYDVCGLLDVFSTVAESLEGSLEELHEKINDLKYSVAKL